MALKFREMKLTSLHFDVTFKVSQERVTHFKNKINKINRKGKVSYFNLSQLSTNSVSFDL